MKKVLAMDDIVGELRDCAADSAEVGYKSRAQVAMLRAADDIVALQGRIVRQCQSVNELVAATEKCIEERDALRARVAELEAALQGVVDGSSQRVGYYGYPQYVVEDDAIATVRAVLGLSGNKTAASNEVPK